LRKLLELVGQRLRIARRSDVGRHRHLPEGTES
jgi:hypothetical protein